MPTITPIIFAALYILSGLINFGLVMAVLTRYKIKAFLSPRDILMYYLAASAAGILGFFATFSIFSSTGCGCYGLKFWPGEIHIPGNKWHHKLLEVRLDMEEKARNKELFEKYHGNGSGQCKSIWRN